MSAFQKSFLIIGAIGLAILLVLLTIIATQAFLPTRTLTVNQSTAATPGISVSGQGTVKIKPDVAYVNLGVEIKADTVAEAQRKASEAMNKVEDKLKSMGLKEEDWGTVTFSIEPQFEYDRGIAPRLTGYKVTNIIKVTIKKLDDIGKIIDGAVEAGATTVQSVTFDLLDPKPAQKQARELAVRDARTKAEALAGTAGVKLGNVLGISEQVIRPIAETKTLVGEPAPTTPITPSNLEVSVSVQVNYTVE